MGFTDALRGYAFPAHNRDGFRCVYCGLDGAASFEAWLSLSQEHLLPKGHPKRDDLTYSVTACGFCNWADNWYFRHAATRGLTFDGKTPKELIEQRRPFVLKVRDEYRKFWEQKVRGRGTTVA